MEIYGQYSMYIICHVLFLLTNEAENTVQMWVNKLVYRFFIVVRMGKSYETQGT